MTDTWVDISQSLDTIRKLLKLIDNGDNTYSVSSAFASAQDVTLLDANSWTAKFTPLDELRTVIPSRLVGTGFSGTTLDTQFWTETVANGGTVVEASGQVALETNTTANGSAIIQSVGYGHYYAGSPNRFLTNLQLGDTGTANNIRRWGAFDANNGVFFQLSGTTLSVVTRKATVDTVVASSAWDIPDATLTLTENNLYEIYWTESDVYFIVSGILVHTVDGKAATWTANYSLPVRFENTNSGDSILDIKLYVREAAIHRMGLVAAQPKTYFQSGTTAGVVLKRGHGNLHGLIVSAVSQNSVVTLYDNVAASGTILWASGAMGALTQPFSLDLMFAPFHTGLTLVISGANSNVLVGYE